MQWRQHIQKNIAQADASKIAAHQGAAPHKAGILGKGHSLWLRQEIRRLTTMIANGESIIAAANPQNDASRSASPVAE